MRLILRHFPQEQPNGDRATTKTKCHRYELWIEDGENKAIIADADDFNNWWCDVDSKREDYKKLRSRSLEMATVLKVNLEEVLMEEKVIERTEWVEEKPIDPATLKG